MFVSVPCGVFVFLNYGLKGKATKRLQFPSPAGSSYFSINCQVFPVCIRPDGFRPLRGLRISQSSSGTENGKRPSCFRPLRGLRISQSRTAIAIAGAAWEFPSPAGSSYFSIVMSDSLRFDWVGCFRPLRGLRISQSYVRLDKRIEVWVSVPCGVFVFLNEFDKLVAKKKKAVSVPCGVFVFLNIVVNDSFPSGLREVSVPCGVFVFLNRASILPMTRRRGCFRPLRGLRISQSCNTGKQQHPAEGFRPLRGLRISQ